MVKSLLVPVMKISAAAALLLSAPLAMARADVGWSVTVGSPGYMYSPPPPAVVYVEPRPVYVRPRPVYVQPAPVYVQPAPVVSYGAPVYYVEQPRGRWKHRHQRHHHFHGR